MKLIADSGSTKTHWCLLDKGNLQVEVFSSGINPFYQTRDEISEAIKLQLLPSLLSSATISSICFYGAGCAFPEKKAMVQESIASFFPESEITVNNDLLASARALFGNKEGIACILGTGSNSCFYDGVEIVENVSPLGFILGDEGSGAVLGKKFVADVLKNQLPTDLIKSFFAQCNTSAAEIMEAVYKKPFPNRYLAQFTRFMYEHKHMLPVRNIINESFDAFFERNVFQYEYKKHPVSFVGSVAFYFQDILRETAQKKDILVGQIIDNPMLGLLEYHR